MLYNMKTTDEEDAITTNICANCGKEGSDVNNTCNKCKMVKYCNAACKKKHKKKHKKACDRRVAELHDEALFKPPPLQYGDCPICFERIPLRISGSKYNACCGKRICSGCFVANAKIDIKKQLCAFCRTPNPKSTEESRRRAKKRMEAGDAEAIFNFAVFYAQGRNGLPQDYEKALELYHRAGDIGCSQAYHNIGCAYLNGTGVEVDEKKAIHYWELAAMQGHADARHNLGNMEARAGNSDRAIRHWMIAVRSGYTGSLRGIKLLYTEGHATKDDCTKALQHYQEYLNEVKSVQRDEAAAAGDQYKYY